MRVTRRRQTPAWTRLAVLVQQARCTVCGELLRDSKIEYDHRPPLSQREWDDATQDYIPPQLDPEYMEAIHADCHQQRTTGRKPGATKTATTAGSDVHIAAKIKRMNAPKKAKRKIPSRKLQSRGFR